MSKALAVVRFGQERLLETYERYERFLPAVSFVLGVLFDVLTLGRIDETHVTAQLGVYLALAMAILGVEIWDAQRPIAVAPKVERWWRYREEVAHFLYGSLLSAFAIFYFKSSSIWGAFLFYLVIVTCLVGNEFPSVRRRAGLPLRTALFALCLVSFFAGVTPVWYGRLGALPFLTAIGVAVLVFALLVAALWRFLPDRRALARWTGVPFAAVVTVFVAFYFARVIPPVPLSLSSIGIYRSVERVAGGYEVTHRKPDWRFWHTGDQRFAHRAGDRVYCFFSVFSPTGFKEAVRVRWLHDDPKEGWKTTDTMTVPIVGGRADGYRGFAYKASVKPGAWQVRIETSDGREIGRIRLTVEPDASTEPAETKRERV